jgi:prepilin-type processing-associated H-X9-DG protein
MRRSPAKLLAAGLLIFAGVAALLVGLYLHHVRYWMYRDGCAANLRQIAQAMLLYSDAHGGEYPDSLQTLMTTSDVQSIVFVCPMTSDTAAEGKSSQAVARQLVAGGHLSYVYVGRGLIDKTAGANTVVAYEAISNHGDGINVLFGDGHVEFIDAAMGAAIAAQAAAGSLPILLQSER